MSQIYNLEPPTSGQVVLETTHGPLRINLWTKEAPTTTKNFLQHCMNGYYDGLAFHRIIPEVLAQTGDPSATGTGGEAAIGDPAGYQRELHGRLKFRRRGLVAMVCHHAKARSQFFITLSAADWLNGEHSIFGEVAGNTIYNLLNLAENPVDGFEVEGAPKVKAARIVENPFVGLVPRKVVRTADKVATAVNAKQAVRSRNLLSFADSDSEEEDAFVPKKRPRSRFGDASGAVEARAVDGAGRGKNTASEAQQQIAGKEEEEDEIIRKANEEFARLKAQFDGGEEESRRPNSVQEQSDNTKPANEGNDDIEKPRNAQVRDPFTGKIRKRNRDDSDTLKRWHEFETRIRKSRSKTAPNGSGRVNGAWFERGLRLPTKAMEEEEYEVFFGKPRRKR